MPVRRTRFSAAALGAATLAVATSATVDPGVVERLTREVRRAIATHSGQSDDATLIALRGLRDERLRPLFAEMASRENDASRLHGIFGLADLSPDRRVSVVQLAGITSREVRALALGRAIGGDYLSADQLRQVLTWQELEPSIELLVTARLFREGETPSTDRLREIADACAPDEVATRVFAQLLIAQVEGDAEATEARQSIETVPEDKRDALIAFTLAQVMVEDLHALTGFVASMHDWARARERVRLQSLSALLEVAPADGLAEWRTAYAAEQDLSGRIRLGLVLLDASPFIPPDAFDPLIDDEVTLIDLMGRAGRGVAAEQAEPDALFALLDQNHRPTLAWTFDALDAMDEPRRARILPELMRLATSAREPTAPVPAYLYELARSLETATPGSLTPFLADSARRADAPLCEALLSALMEADPHPAWEVPAPPWPDRRCRALAAIARARTRQQLPPDQLDLLVSAGTGGEALPPAFRVMAAWLALGQLRKDREALAEVLAPSDE